MECTPAAERLVALEYGRVTNNRDARRRETLGSKNAFPVFPERKTRCNHRKFDERTENPKAPLNPG